MGNTVNKTGRTKGRERYVEAPHYLIKCHAWRCLSVHSRSAWIELMTEYFGTNNGKIIMSARMLGERLNCSRSHAAETIRELITYGFVEISKASSFSKKRMATEYRMTHLKCDATGKVPSKAFMRAQQGADHSHTNASHSPPRRTHSPLSGHP